SIDRVNHGHRIADAEGSWDMVKSVLELAARGEGNLKKLHFLMFPEVSIPASRFDEALELVDRGLRSNTVTMFGVEHVSLKVYRELLERFREDNAEAITYVDRDIDSGEVLEMPVNWCCIAVKEADRKLRVFLEAKSHPFFGEEFLDTFHDLYRGRHLWFFRCGATCFNFMALICFDYLYRSLYASNIKQIIDHANRLYFTTKQGLDALFVLQCNPKPEHPAYREVISGFYGEYLEDTPGVRETVTIFGNSSSETTIAGKVTPEHFGRSFVVMNRHHRLAEVKFAEFCTDDFGGAPVSRLRFGTGTRLIYFNLPLHHELDPRSSRVPLKVHWLMKPGRRWEWEKIGGEEMVTI
ncbi:MAG TPA: hypothetical protein VNX25_05395, partial [Verrucomicrobiae bacterium]|nr:hypothetical protein [Verrucomicrobiae bacterium]